MEREITTKSLQGISDLTLVAPIKQGFIDALETRTYASRLRAVLKTLHTLRQTSREHSLVRPFSDATDRIRTISDLRMAILEDEQKLLLSVTFDRPWEPYLRIIWRDVGTLLDVIFCNCEPYVTSFDNNFAAYGAWVRNARTNVQFFYRASALTFDDVQYLREVERRHRENAASKLDLSKLVAPDATQTAERTARGFPSHTARQGFQALSVLYRLVDLYPDERDSGILWRAARQLLRELIPIASGPLPDMVGKRFEAQLAWFNEKTDAPPPRVAPTLGATRDVQGGILTAYPGVTHGCMLLLSVSDSSAAAKLIDSLAPMVSYEARRTSSDDIYVNVAFTREGLCALGVPKAEMEQFPHEFLEGMQERAGLIGDVRGNHPRNWALPQRNWPAPIVDDSGSVASVQLATVHVVVHMYTASRDTGHELIDPLKEKIKALMDGRDKVQLLSVEPMRRYIDDPIKGTSREHFGFVDGISQPEIGTPHPGKAWSNFIGPGELLLGYANDRGDEAAPSDLLDNGTFLVVRKMRQDVGAFNAAIAGSGVAPDAVDALKAKMVGRTVDGDPLTAPGLGNNFTYTNDDGAQCPFAAHIRRANPRSDINPLDGRPAVPRIMRRGMSYGPRFDDDEKAERGLIFMGYNASIAEQFEVIQRWISGGNSTGVLSEQSDPLLGVPQLGETRVFRYREGTSVKTMKLDDAKQNPSEPFVRLEWGVYLFVPSKPALTKLQRHRRSIPQAERDCCSRSRPGGRNHRVTSAGGRRRSASGSRESPGPGGMEGRSRRHPCAQQRPVRGRVGGNTRAA